MFSDIFEVIFGGISEGIKPSLANVIILHNLYNIDYV